MNLGNAIQKRWYAAEHLVILPWQVVRGQLPPTYAGDMVKWAKRSPEENKTAIRHAFGILGLNAVGNVAPYHRVKRSTNIRL